MPTALQRQYARLERQRAALLDRLGTYGDVQHAYQPDAECWSLAGVVQHLVLVEEALVRNGRKQAATRPARVTLPSRVKARIVLSVLARDTRIRAPVAAIVPQTHVPIALLGPRWAAARTDLLKYLDELPGPVWLRTAFYHPRTDWITASGGLRFLEAHCAHHFRQIDRIIGSASFPAC
ncbi:MAG: DinB family protein [Gemmatimonadales bacterium]|nr:DinB family protein [Gemmatimonadales bacterium]